MVDQSSARAYVIISSDNHAGADLLDYKPYLESKWHDEFDVWAASYSNPWDFFDPRLSDDTFDSSEAILVGPTSYHSSLNWDSSRRIRDLESNGVVAEVIFPNTSPPFMPSSVLTGVPPESRQDYERRWAGLRAHNRWLVDFCHEFPRQRAGVAQIMTYDVEDAVAEVRVARDAGLTGGVLLPMDPRDAGGVTPLYFMRHEPLWAVCEELQMPVHRHGATPSTRTPDAETGPAVVAIGLAERDFFNHRSLAQFIMSGIFERYPRLKLIITECGSGWVPTYLQMLDALFLAGSDSTSLINPLVAPAADQMSMRPSEYFARNCFLGASLFLPSEAKRRYEIGVGNIMWGVDYPHSEGTFPFSLEALQLTFSDVPETEVRRMLGATAAEVFGFDLTYLQELADLVGPKVEDVAHPPKRLPKVPEECMSPTFASTPFMEFGRAG
jgi:predicted TIM-barrel fold metal-dependent hydrolase